MDELDLLQASQLVGLARKSIKEELGAGETDGVDDLPAEERGCFVTLKVDEDLRGCIGNAMPDKGLGEAVKSNARKAAFEDPRFPPISLQELEETTVELSVLTVPVEIDGENPVEVREEVEPGRDGLIVEDDYSKGLLLPQVAEENAWDSEQFLRETARKAGLPPEKWRSEGTEVKRFSAQIFREKSPGGGIEEETFF